MAVNLCVVEPRRLGSDSSVSSEENRVTFRRQSAYRRMGAMSSSIGGRLKCLSSSSASTYRKFSIHSPEKSWTLSIVALIPLIPVVHRETTPAAGQNRRKSPIIRPMRSPTMYGRLMPGLEVSLASLRARICALALLLYPNIGAFLKGDVSQMIDSGWTRIERCGLWLFRVAGSNCALSCAGVGYSILKLTQLTQLNSTSTGMFRIHNRMYARDTAKGVFVYVHSSTFHAWNYITQDSSYYQR